MKFNERFDNMNKLKNGFTLAEVLITLGVIGVVSAITIPTLIQKQHEAQRLTQFKKAVSAFNQAYLQMTLDYDQLHTWGLKNTDTGEKDENGNTIKDRSSSQLIMQRLIKYYNGAEFVEVGTNEGDWYTLSGKPMFVPNIQDTEYHAFKVNDGTIIHSAWTQQCSKPDDICWSIWIVFPKKGKMLVGKDIFYFDVNSVKGLVPALSIGTGNLNIVANHCTTQDVNDSNNGKGCAGWIMANGNMDYLHCDDLSFDSKTKCK